MVAMIIDSDSLKNVRAPPSFPIVFDDVFPHALQDPGVRAEHACFATAYRAVTAEGKGRTSLDCSWRLQRGQSMASSATRRCYRCVAGAHAWWREAGLECLLSCGWRAATRLPWPHRPLHALGRADPLMLVP